MVKGGKKDIGRRDAVGVGVFSDRGWELKFAATEVVALNGEKEGEFLVARLMEDVLLSTENEAEVTVVWFEKNKDEEWIAEENALQEKIQVGAIICALTGLVTEFADEETWRVSVSKRAGDFVLAQLKKQLRDDYESDADSEFGDAVVAKRLAKIPGKKTLLIGAGTQDSGSEAGDPGENFEDGEGRATKKRKKSKEKSGGSGKQGRKKKKKALIPRKDIEENPMDPYKMKTGKLATYSGDSDRASREVIRAVQANDQKAFQLALKDANGEGSNKITRGLNACRSIALRENALMLAFRLGDQEKMAMLIDSFRPQQQSVGIELNTMGTGEHTSMFANYNRRAINASRGGKEGNDAFLKDVNLILDSNNPLWKPESLLWPCLDSMDFDLPSGEDVLNELEKRSVFFSDWGEIDSVVASGNLSIAKRYLELNPDETMFNFVHREVCAREVPGNSPFSKPVRAPSVTKKSESNSAFTPVHLACINPNTAFLEKLLQINPEAAHTLDRGKKTLLHYAAAASSPDPVKFLLNSNPQLDRNMFDSQRTTPLSVAVRSGRVENIAPLLDVVDENQKDAMLNSKGPGGFSPIHFAALSMRATADDVLEALLDAGADPTKNAPTDRNKQIPVNIAASMGKIGALKILQKYGADLQDTDKLDRTPLMFAAMTDNFPTLCFLLREGVDVDAKDTSGNTCLHYAVSSGASECVKLLLKYTASPNCGNNWNLSPLGLAVLKKRHDCLRILLEDKKVSLDFRDASGRSLVFRMFADYVHEVVEKIDETTKLAPPSVKAVKKDLPWVLLHVLEGRKDVDLSISDAEGLSILHVIADAKLKCKAAEKWAVALLELLTKKGLNPSFEDKNGMSALLTAATAGNFGLVEKLIALGVQAEHRNNQGKNILHFVLSSCPTDASVISLLEKAIGVDAVKGILETVDDDGMTPILIFAKALSTSGAKHDDFVKSVGVFWKLLQRFPQLSTHVVGEYGWAQQDRFEKLLELDTSSDKELSREAELSKKIKAFVAQDANRDETMDFESSDRGKTIASFFAQITDPERLRKSLLTVLPCFEEHQDLLVERDAEGLDLLGVLLRKTLPRLGQTADFSQNAQQVEDEEEEDDDDEDDDEDEEMDSEMDDEDEMSDLADLPGKSAKAPIQEAHPPSGFGNQEEKTQKVFLKVLDQVLKIIGDISADLNQTPVSAVPYASKEEDFFLGGDEEKEELAKAVRTQKDLKSFKKLVELCKKKRLLDANPKRLKPKPCIHLLIEQMGKRCTISLMKELMKRGLDLAATDEKCEESLAHIAARFLRKDVLEFLGCDTQLKKLMTLQDEKGMTPLTVAAVGNHSETLRAVLENGGASTVNVGTADGRRPLHFSVEHAVRRVSDDKQPCEAMLLEAGADVSVQDKHQRTPLHLCFLGGVEHDDLFDFPHTFPSCDGKIDPVELVALLLAGSGAMDAVKVFDCGGRTPLFYAAARSAIVSSLLLTAKGADLFKTDIDGNNVLNVALLRDHAEYVIVMLKSSSASAIPGLPDVQEVHRQKRAKIGAPPLQYEVTEISRQNHSIMWYAIKKGFKGLIYILLDIVPHEVSVSDALEHGSFQLALRLINACSDDTVRAVTSQRTLLHRVAAIESYSDGEWAVKIAERIIERNVPILQVDGNGQTALHLAAKNLNKVLVKFLVEKMPPESKRKRDAQGDTPRAAMMRRGRSITDAKLAQEMLRMLDGSTNDQVIERFKITTTSKAHFEFHGIEFRPGPNRETVMKDLTTISNSSPNGEASEMQMEDASPPNGKTTFVIEAVKSGLVQLLEVVLEAGFDPQLCDSEGLAPLHHAILMDDFGACLVLLAFGADPDLSLNSNLTPVMMTALRCAESNEAAFSIMELLLRHNANVMRASDLSGNTVLHFAAGENRKRICELLLEASRTEVAGPSKSSTISEPVISRMKEEFRYRGGPANLSPQWLCRIANETALRAVLDFRSEKNNPEVLVTFRQLPGSETISDERSRVLKLLGAAGVSEFGTAIMQSTALNSVAKLKDNCWNLPRILQEELGHPVQLSYEVLFKISDEGKKFADRAEQISRAQKSVWLPVKALTELLDAKSLKIETHVALEELAKKKGLSEAQWRAEKRNWKGFEFAKLGKTDAMLTLPLKAGADVLLESGGMWLEGKVAAANPNGTFDVQVARGELYRAVWRRKLRPSKWNRKITSHGDRPRQLAAMRNKEGQTCLDLMLVPMKQASFENEELAKLLLKAGTSVNATTLKRARPGSRIRALLLLLGDKMDESNDDGDEEEAAKIFGSLSSQPALEPLPEQELQKVIQEAYKEVEAMGLDKVAKAKPSVNPICHNHQTKVVVAVKDDPADMLDYYDVVLTKVDVKRGHFGILSLNNFYKMQVVKDEIQDNMFVLITHWGRIGDRFGKHQQTPFPSQTEAVKEFGKVFKSKTGNLWSERRAFEARPKKYSIVARLSHKYERPQLPNLADIVDERDDTFSNECIAQSNLAEPIEEAFRTFTDPEELQKAAKYCGLADEKVPLGRLKFENLLEAEKVLAEVAKYCDIVEKLCKESQTNLEELRESRNEVVRLTNKFYSLIPTDESRFDKALAPFEKDSVRFRQAVENVRQLKDLTTASSLITSAFVHRKEENPFNFIYRALQISMAPLEVGTTERTMLEQYFRNTAGDVNLYVNEVFRVHRNLENYSGSTIPNRKLLFHGTPAANLLGVLNDGLRIAPPEAPSAGFAFGKGIYFADKAAKSLGYCRANLRQPFDPRKPRQPKAYLVVCEVALGAQYIVTDPEYMEKAPDGYQSTLAIGETQPDPEKDATFRTGFTVPLGPITVRPSTKTKRTYWNCSAGQPKRADIRRIETAREDPKSKFPLKVSPVQFENDPTSESYEFIIETPLARTATLRPLDAGTQKAKKSKKTKKFTSKKRKRDLDGDTADEDSEDDESMVDALEAEDEEIQDSIAMEKLDFTGHSFLDCNEYIVYDTSQVSLKYVLEICDSKWLTAKLKNDNETKEQ